MADYEDIVAFFSGLAESAGRGGEAAERRRAGRRSEEMGTASLLMSIRNMLGQEKGEEFRRSLAQAGAQREEKLFPAQLEAAQTRAGVGGAQLGDIEREREARTAFESTLGEGDFDPNDPLLRTQAREAGYDPDELLGRLPTPERYPGEFDLSRRGLESLIGSREAGPKARTAQQQLSEFKVLYSNKQKEFDSWNDSNYFSIIANNDERNKAQNEGRQPKFPYPHVEEKRRKYVRELSELTEKYLEAQGKVQADLMDYFGGEVGTDIEGLGAQLGGLGEVPRGVGGEAGGYGVDPIEEALNQILQKALSERAGEY